MSQPSDHEHLSWLESATDGLAQILVAINDGVEAAISSIGDGFATGVKNTGEFLDAHEKEIMPILRTAVQVLLTHHARNNKAVARQLAGAPGGVASDLIAHVVHHTGVALSGVRNYSADDIRKAANTIATNAAQSVAMQWSRSPAQR